MGRPRILRKGIERFYDKRKLFDAELVDPNGLLRDPNIRNEGDIMMIRNYQREGYIIFGRRRKKGSPREVYAFHLRRRHRM